MATILFKGFNTFVSDEVVEHNGQSYDPKTLIRVVTDKDNASLKGMIWGSIIAIIGLICLFSGWVIFGLIVFVCGGGWAAFNYYQYQDERADSFVTASFSGGRHTGSPDVFVAPIRGFNKAKELEKALWQAKES
jgi:hypothetical protein